MICCSRCFYLLAFFLFFATSSSFGQASCKPVSENSVLTFLKFGSTANDAPASAERVCCSKQAASVSVKAVKVESAADAGVLNCDPEKCEPCPLSCCEGFPGCGKAKVAGDKAQCSEAEKRQCRPAGKMGKAVKL